MTADVQAALWITAVGSAILFASIGGLVILMYFLTAPWVASKAERIDRRSRRRTRKRRFGRPRRREPPAVADIEAAVDDAERERRLRAVALATAIACAETSEVSLTPAIAQTADWRLLHRARRLNLRVPSRRRRS
jgi:hypothetical protein